jgi:hypothetical protein
MAMRLLPCTAAALLLASAAAPAADHLDTPTVIADPAADIGDLYAWMSADRRHLNLVLDLFGPRLSDAVDYRFHIGSGRGFGQRTRSRIDLRCRFAVDGAVDCHGPRTERVHGHAGSEAGLSSRSGRLRVYTGLRNDPFFNNVNGTRWAYGAAAEALATGTSRDSAGCPAFDAKASAEIRRRWASTSDGSPTDFLRGWKVSALVLQVDLDLVGRGGPLLAVWATTARRSDGAVLDRMGRPLIENALLGPLDPEAEINARKEAWNRASPRDWPDFAPAIARTLALYDGFDGNCGNQWKHGAENGPRKSGRGEGGEGQGASGRYQALAGLLADDRLWIDSRHSRCTTFLAVERGISGDCGGRAPTLDAPDVFRSLLMDGSVDGLPDGTDHDDGRHSDRQFPFLGAP